MADTQTKPSLALQRIYVKDLSFESPQSPNCFTQEWKPKINLELKTKHSKIDRSHYEVIIAVTIKGVIDVKDNDTTEAKTTFIVELQQAGIFAISGIEESNMDRVLSTICANTLFPYARENIDSILNRGSFPPIMLAPINFDALYNEIQKRKQQKQAETTEGAVN